MRTYFVVIDETEEAKAALRYASHRASRTKGSIHILALIEPTEIVPWGNVQATITEEAQLRAEELLVSSAGEILEESGIRPIITVKQGQGVKIVRTMLEENPNVAALVLGAAPSGPPGPLVSHFTGNGCGDLPCPIMVIPGGLSNEDLDKLS